MSTQPVSSNSVATGSTLNSLGSGTPMQITGLASGLDTNAVVKALMAAQQQQVTNLTNQQSGITALNNQLTSIQTALQAVSADAQALGSPSLWTSTQTISSTNPTLVSATGTSNTGAVIGGYQIAVTALASASQRTFSFTSPGAADTITIDGHNTQLAAGATAQDFANAINSDSHATVWATVTNNPQSGPATVVLSERATGQPATPTGFVTVTGDSAGALSEQAAYALAGTNAAYTINGGAPQYSTSNTISGAPVSGAPNSGNPGASQTIPGVSLSLNGLTGATPITVNVGAPGANTQNIQTAVQKFITDYNSAITQIQTQLAQPPNPNDPTRGTLYGDTDLQQLLGTLRQQMVATVGGLTGSVKSMLDIGVSTGATTGTATVSQSALAGDLTLDSTTLTAALANNSGDVKSMLQSWSISFSSTVDNEAAAGGTISTRIQTDNSQISYLANQIQNLTEANALKQHELVQEFAQMEAALSANQSQASWLTSQLSALPHP